MNKYQFHWHVSYMEHVCYRVYGGEFSSNASGSGEIQLNHPYTPDHHMVVYARSTYNGNDEEFARDYLARLGGAAVRWHTYRWTPELFQSFCDHLRQDHIREVTECMAMWKRQQYTPSSDVISELYSHHFIPRPIYWDHDARTWLNEPWWVPPERFVTVVYEDSSVHRCKLEEWQNENRADPEAMAVIDRIRAGRMVSLGGGAQPLCRVYAE